MHPDDVEYVQNIVIEKIQHKKEQFNYEYRIISEKGNLKYLLGNFKTIHDKNGVLVKLRGFVQDITERKLNETLISSVLENSFNGVLLCDPVYVNEQLDDFKCILANPYAKKVIGNIERDVLGSYIFRDITLGKSHYIYDMFKECFVQNTIQKAEHYSEIRQKYFEVQACKVNHHLMITFIDITESTLLKKNLENKVIERTLELTHTNNQLVKINSDLDNFIYTASHDLKAPISNIEGLLEMLKQSIASDCTVNSDVQVIISMFASSINRFKATIHELTDITKITKEFEEINPQANDLQTLVSEICKDTLGNLIKENNAEVKEDYEIKSIFFSRKNLRRILYNIISNSIKYRDFKRIPLIKIKTEKLSDTNLLLTIADNGLGIRKDQLDKIFQMFKRLHDHVEGTGVGLYIVKKIIENSGGRIEVESELGKGTTFKIYLIQNL